MNLENPCIFANAYIDSQAWSLPFGNVGEGKVSRGGTPSNGEWRMAGWGRNQGNKPNPQAEALGASTFVDGTSNDECIRAERTALLGEATFKASAKALGKRYAEVTPERAAEVAARRVIERVSEGDVL